MPLPKPRSSEKQDDFISRCMGHGTMNKDFPENDQRAAVCHSQWREAHPQADEAMEHYSLLAQNYTIREEVFQGKKHLVIPAVLMVEGVHAGSHGPLLHLAEDLGKFPGSWDGIPVSIQHPTEDGSPVSCNQPHVIDSQVVGRTFGTFMDGGKLRSEVWVSLEDITRIAPEALEYIREGKPVDVSVGVFTEDDMAAGEWNGERYAGIARNHRPDHLALLPGATGACSWSDGCGLRANQDGGEVKHKCSICGSVYGPKNAPFKGDLGICPYCSQGGGIDMNKEDQTKEGLMDSLTALGLININKMSHQEIGRKIQAKLDRMDDDMKLHFLVECYDDHFIYRISPKNGPSTGEELYKRSYRMTNDEVEFTGEAQPVVKKTEYVNTNEEENNMSKKQPCCEAKVQMLIEAGLYSEDHRERLLAMEEADIDVLVNASGDKAKMKAKIDEMETKLKEMKDKMATMQSNEASATTREQAIQVLRDEMKDKDKFLALAPTEVRATLEHGQRLYQAERDAMVLSIEANSGGVLTKEYLSGKDFSELQMLARAYPVPRNDFSLNGPTPQANAGDDEVLMPTGMNG